MVKELAIYYSARDSATREAFLALEQEDGTKLKTKRALKACVECRGERHNIEKVLCCEED